ncbi:ribosome small subunit-dependent GTPase A [Pseudoponticoccus marisrubri]|uniref:Small ribosomal subunit biogenesis GTPase RsgA n=1 Tax=Pseudoponticoccus marisrubri TaxID=1685382 RepID=A0A0W7WLT3_9RHOB|nr:ribosome small subunit-dependent GTPase A [Pseudoponticoccus marisrubri]KUF11514.1 GTPase RsgA [Pseudoponticoccus marisrubri]
MTKSTLSDLGWSDHFARQVDPGAASLTPARLTEVQRDRLRALGPDGAITLIPTEPAGAYAVGDWVLCEDGRALTRLAARTELARRAAGREARVQRIAANVDTLGIVTSCNADFNPSRLERYLAMALAADCLPLVVLTKADQSDTAEGFRRQAARLSPLVTALTLDATDPEEVARLHPWCRDGQTLALVGSSGVGKTTLRNALSGDAAAATQGIRADDAKGRHTTTFRSLVPTRAGGWLIDTPGMRELQLTEMQEGIDEVFEDISELAARCRFSDCRHAEEPGCAVQGAIAQGTLDPERLRRWEKLRREDLYNSETVAEARARQKGFARMVKGAQSKGRRKRDPNRAG